MVERALQNNTGNWHSSYETLTAENIFRKYGVSFSQAEVNDALSLDTGFHKLLLILPALWLDNQNIINETKEIYKNTQSRLQKIKRQREESAEGHIQGPIDNRISTLEQGLRDLDQSIISLLQRQEQLNTDIQHINEECLQHWQNFTEQQIQQIKDCLNENGIELSTESLADLQRVMLKQSAGEKVTDQLQQEFEKELQNPILKAFILSQAEAS